MGARFVKSRNQSVDVLRDPLTRGVILGLLAILIGLPLTGWATYFTRIVPDGHVDFRANYAAGYMLRTGRPLYDPSAELEAQNISVSPELVTLPFIHPAYEAIFYAPLSLLSFQKAYWLFFAFNLILLAGIYRLLPELQVLRDVAGWAPAAALFAFIPFGGALAQGQDSVIFALLLAIAFRLLKTERLFLAGAILGLGAFRFQLLLPLMLCFVLWRKWKLIAGCAITWTLVTAISIALADPRRYMSVLASFRNDSSPVAMQAPFAQMANLYGLIRSLGGSEAAVIFASIAVVIVATFVGRNLALPRQFAIAITVAALTSYHMFLHDLSILFIPLAMLIADGRLSVAALGFIAPALMIASPTHFYVAALVVLVILKGVAGEIRFRELLSFALPDLLFGKRHLP